MEELRRIHEQIKNYRPATVSEEAGEMPIDFTHGDSQVERLDPMLFRLNQWTPTQWAGCHCKGLILLNDQISVLCEVTIPRRFNKHVHPGWDETLTMHEGEMLEHTTGDIYRPGDGLYFQPSERVHEPEFLSPGLCLITWRRCE